MYAQHIYATLATHADLLLLIKIYLSCLAVAGWPGEQEDRSTTFVNAIPIHVHTYIPIHTIYTCTIVLHIVVNS